MSISSKPLQASITGFGGPAAPSSDVAAVGVGEAVVCITIEHSSVRANVSESPRLTTLWGPLAFVNSVPRHPGAENGDEGGQRPDRGAVLNRSTLHYLDSPCKRGAGGRPHRLYRLAPVGH